ncbi:MAG: hypothetical protein GY938_16445 [Ketobacter sp.]|nr:hypothetical protein [Ketobacter sp.]
MASTLSTISASYRTETTTNGSGVKASPISAENITGAVSLQIQSSFVEDDLVAQKISQAAIVGKNMNATFAFFKTQIDSFKPKLDTAVTNIENDVTRVKNVMEDNDKWAPIAFWILFAFSIVIIILAAIVLCLLCKMCSNSECMNCIYCSKFILVLLAFLVLVFGVLVIILMIGTASMSAVCEVIGQLVNRNVSVLTDINVKVTPEMTDLLDNCLKSNSNGSLRGFLGIENN